MVKKGDFRAGRAKLLLSRGVMPGSAGALPYQIAYNRKSSQSTKFLQLEYF